MAGNAKYNLHLRYIYTYMLLYKYMCEIVLGTGLVGFFGYLGIWATIKEKEHNQMLSD